MSEPIYEYVKGSGWQVSYCKSITRQFDGFKVTLYNRKPEGGEHYYRDPKGYVFEQTCTNIFSMCRDYNNCLKLGVTLETHPRLDIEGVWVTLLVEKT